MTKTLVGTPDPEPEPQGKTWLSTGYPTWPLTYSSNSSVGAQWWWAVLAST